MSDKIREMRGHAHGVGLGERAAGMLGAAYAANHNWGGVRPGAFSVLGHGADAVLGTGHTFARAGDVADVAGEMKTLGAVRGGLAGYGAYAIADAASQAGAHLTGERTLEDVDADNDRQRGQGYLRNVGENLLTPAKATVQAATDWRGMASDVQDAYDSGQKAKAMQQQHDFNKKANAGIRNRQNYDSNAGALQGLLGGQR